MLLVLAALAGALLWLALRTLDQDRAPPPLGMSQAPCTQFDPQRKEDRPAYDWASLCTFEADNAHLLKSGMRPKVVAFGDSLTWRWALDGPGLVKRGIPSQTSAHLLLRFRSDVVALRPRAVHILVGTNDIAGATGPSSPQRVIANIASMVDLAQANDIVPILATVPPARSPVWRNGVRPYPWIDRLNAEIRALATDRGLVLADYHAVLAGPDGHFRPGLSEDEAHPNLAGYAGMRPVFDKAVAEALPD
jgi:lysophospholipase L1-like esterase